jgi:hypothetical protein
MVARNFHTDFSEYTAGAKPSDWTRRWVSTPGGWTIVANSGKGGAKNGLQSGGLTAVRNSMSWDAIDPADPDSADIDVLARWKSSNGTGNFDARFMARGSGVSGTENGYQGGIGNGFRRADRYVAGASAVVGSSSPAALVVAADTFAFTRFRINGTLISTKSWLDDGITLESDAPLYSWTNTEISGPGWAGVFQAITNGVTTFDELAIATGGLVAAFTTTIEKEITDTLALTDPGSSLSVAHNIVVTDGIGISDARVSDLVSQFNLVITDRLNSTDSRVVSGSTTTNLTIVDAMDLIDDALIQTLIPGDTGSGDPSDEIIARGTDIIEQLIAAGYTVGSIMDRERARLLAKTGASPVGNTLQDLYFLANERPRL